MGYLLSRFRWYRRRKGGRWEYHFIDMCRASMWLHMRPEPERQWPLYRQPCSVGVPIIEDYPVKGKP